MTSYETGLAGHHTFRSEHLEADPLITDERFLAAKAALAQAFAPTHYAPSVVGTLYRLRAPT